MMTNRLFLFLIIGCCPLFLFSQEKNDFQWVLDDYIRMDFRYDTLQIDVLPNAPTNLNPGAYSTSICDSTGALIFYTGGCYILNRENQIMLNGDSITGDWVLDLWCGYNLFPLSQNNTILPYPQNPNKYYIFNYDFIDPFGIGGPLPLPLHLYCHIVDMTLDNGLGGVTTKKKVILEDTIARGYLQAVRHANGSDWWVVAPKWNSNCYFVVSATKDGANLSHIDCLGPVWNNDDLGGQTAFAPDGTKCARAEGVNGLCVFDFDSSNGRLSNPVVLEFPHSGDYRRGVAFSPSSQYLYVCAKDQLFQFDLWASDIQSNVQLVGKLDLTIIQPGQSYLGLAKLGPDGRIYIASPGNHRYLSVINRPDCPGISCDFRQHLVPLPTSNYSGLPNLPSFKNLSPNNNCGPTSSIEKADLSLSRISAYPNPSTGLISFATSSPQQGYWTVFGTLREKISGGHWNGTTATVDFSSLPKGIYFFQLRLNDGKIWHTKFVLR